MFAGLVSPSHLILVLVLLLFGASRIPELAKGFGAGLDELREGISASDDARSEAPEGEKFRGGTSAGSGDEMVHASASQRSF